MELTTREPKTHRDWKKLQLAQRPMNIDISRNVCVRVWLFETLKMSEICWDVKFKCKVANVELLTVYFKIQFFSQLSKEALVVFFIIDWWIAIRIQDFQDIFSNNPGTEADIQQLTACIACRPCVCVEGLFTEPVLSNGWFLNLPGCHFTSVFLMWSSLSQTLLANASPSRHLQKEN